MNLQTCWKKMWPVYREMACYHNRLPGYRDWGRPLMLLGQDGRELGGLSLVFFHPEPFYHAFFAENQILPTEVRPIEEPRGYFVGFTGDRDPDVEPLYRRVGVQGLVTSAKPACRPECTWADWVAALGYTIEEGSDYALSGKRVQLPKRDPVDRAAEAVRIVSHLEWQQAGRQGYLGGELLFLMLAPHFRLDATGLRTGGLLREEIRHLENTDLVTEISLYAAAMAAERIEALGPEHFRCYVDALTAPAPNTLQKSLYDNLIGVTS